MTDMNERGQLLEAAREAEAEVARLRWALKAIKRVAAIEAPPVSDEVPAKVWKIASDALRGHATEELQVDPHHAPA